MDTLLKTKINQNAIFEAAKHLDEQCQKIVETADVLLKKMELITSAQIGGKKNGRKIKKTN